LYFVIISGLGSVQTSFFQPEKMNQEGKYILEQI